MKIHAPKQVFTDAFAKGKWGGLKSTCTKSTCSTVVRLVRVVHVFSGPFHFSQKRPLQKLDADKTSGELPTADIDLICVFKVIVALVLFEEGAKALL